MNVIHANSTNVSGKTFVEPQISPPFHGNDVTEPLKSEIKLNKV